MYSDVSLFTDGVWTKGVAGRSLPVVNPATGELIGTVAHAGGEIRGGDPIRLELPPPLIHRSHPCEAVIGCSRGQTSRSSSPYLQKLPG